MQLRRRLLDTGSKASHFSDRRMYWYLTRCSRSRSEESAVFAPESSNPDYTTYACLKCLRRPDIIGFSELLHSSPTRAGQSGHHLPEAVHSIVVGDLLVHETGPLSCFSDFLDTAARRVLPGHLLRRCRMLSSMQLGGTCLQRIALTACSGEESVFEWRLKNILSMEEATTIRGQMDSLSSPSTSLGETNSSGGADSSWRLISISRDDSADNDDLPLRPHPRASPEVMIMAQLAALRKGDVAGAETFNMLEYTGLSGQRHLPSYRAFLRQAANHHLLIHSSACIVASAGPSQRTFVAEVLLKPQASAADQRDRWDYDMREGSSAGGGDGKGNRYLFELGMQARGWRVEAVRALY